MKIIEAKDLPAEEKIYLRKGFDGWRIVYPIRNEDGTINWNNLIWGGSYWKFIKLLLIFLLLIASIFIYNYDTKTCRETLLHINETCFTLLTANTNIPKIEYPKLNYPKLISDVNQTEEQK